MASEGFVYVIHAVGTDRVKIGFSAEPEKRLLELQTGSPFPLALVGKRDGNVGLERALHVKLEEYRRVGEWFEIDPVQCWEIVIAEPIPLASIEIPDNDHVRIALAHLSMITQAAKKEIRENKDQIEKREAWLVRFILTGEGLATEDARALARLIKDALSTQPTAA